MADAKKGPRPGERLGARPRMEAGAIPAGVHTELTTVTTHDGASAPAVSYRLDGATTTVMLMHPRQDLSRHYLISLLLNAGVSVWVQGVRSVNNDLNLLHEEALLDAAAGIVRVRDGGASHVVLAGPSGGATLFAFYVQQALVAPGERLAHTGRQARAPRRRADAGARRRRLRRPAPRPGRTAARPHRPGGRRRGQPPAHDPRTRPVLARQRVPHPARVVELHPRVPRRLPGRAVREGGAHRRPRPRDRRRSAPRRSSASPPPTTSPTAAPA